MIAKLVAIVVVAVAQIYLLKTMLGKFGQGYQPVWSLWIFKCINNLFMIVVC